MRIRQIRKARKLAPAHLGLILLLTVTVLHLNSCSAENENAPDAPPAAAPIVKPNPVGVKLMPTGFTASKNLPGKDPARVADGDLTTGWNAGEAAPQWIQLDLGEKSTISEVLLNVDQFPEGSTTHEIYGGLTPDSLRLLSTLSGDTKAGQWLRSKVSASDIRYVKVATIKSPSWVGWSEIEVYK